MAAQVTKISLSLDTEALAWVRRTARASGRSVSAVLSDAARAANEAAVAAARRDHAWRTFLEWFHEREAPLTEEELAAVDDELWGTPAPERQAPRKTRRRPSTKARAR